MKQHYQQLVQKLEEITHLNGVMSTLSWDQEVVMPVGAGEARAKQLSALAGVIHERMTDPALGECLQQLSDGSSTHFSKTEQCNIREAQRNYDLETKVPKRLVQELAELGSRGHSIWVKARQDNCFADFAPVLKNFLLLKKSGRSAYRQSCRLMMRILIYSSVAPRWPKLRRFSNV